MPQLALASSFWQGYDALEKSVKAGVKKAMAKFQQLSVAELHADKGLHLESVAKARDPRMRTIRINDFWRGVVLAPDDGTDTFLLLNVVPHDDAYTWAANRLYTVNALTGCLEVRNVEAIEQLAPAMSKAADAAPELLFAKISDTVLRDLGIDNQVLAAVRTLINRQQLEAFGTLLPEDQYEVLFFLADGYSPEQVYRELVATRPVAEPPKDLAAAIAQTASRIALVSSAEELDEILDKPFAAWRVYLHPSQRHVAYRPGYSGPAQVTGGPGTGKTVVALHRVKYLLDRSPDSRVLLTTYTSSLAATLRENLKELVDGRVWGRVDVTTVDGLAYNVVRHLTGQAPSPVGDAEERKVWQRVRKEMGLSWSEQFLTQEYRHVVLAQDLRTLGEYQTAKRHGRGRDSMVRAPQRAQLWAAMEAFEAAMATQGRSTHLQVCARAAGLLTQDSHRKPVYEHVVVDEAQDLHPVQWRALRNIVALGPDDMFITGDPHQRIYDSKVSLTSLGISVAGRSRRLRVNYRSTEEILRWSVGVLSGVEIDDLTGDGIDDLTGYRSLLHGKRPRTAGYPDTTAEADAVVAQIREWIANGVRPQEIAVCGRFNTVLDKIAGRLANAGVPAVRVKDQPRADTEGVRLATMHAMKGLEFRCVAVLGVTASAVPFAREITPPDVDRLQHESDMLRERCVLFVACTRAREALYVSWSGTPSPFLPAARR